MSSKRRTLFLALILIATAALWSGTLGIQLNGDDYQYLPTLAPIQSLGDIFRPFVTPDANPSFFRPVANMTMSLDFLLFHWSGAGFHLTNLLFHLFTTLLVFFFVRNLFGLSDRESLICSLVFGLIASHEYNLVVDTARADELAAIFVMLFFLLAHRKYWIASLSVYLLALLSKEIAFMALPLVPVLLWEPAVRTETAAERKKRIRRWVAKMAPYLIVTVAAYFYHAHFTKSILASEPLQSEGAQSFIAFLHNGAYSLGYFILPLDLKTAMTVLSDYQGLALSIGLALSLSIIVFLGFFRDKILLPVMWKPLVFTFITGAVLFLTFERWRLYLPSVGAIAVIVTGVNRSQSRAFRKIIVALIVPLSLFHLYRAWDAQFEWRTATALLDGLKSSATEILASNPRRPLTLGLLDVPAKLGSASVAQLGVDALLTRAEADRLNLYNRKTAEVNGVRVATWSAVDVYALDAKEGYRGLSVTSLGQNRYTISVPLTSSIALYPAEIAPSGIPRRDRSLREGDSIVAPDFEAIVRSVSDGIAKSIEVHVLDTNTVLLSFSNFSFVQIPR